LYATLLPTSASASRSWGVCRNDYHYRIHRQGCQVPGGAKPTRVESTLLNSPDIARQDRLRRHERGLRLLGGILHPGDGFAALWPRHGRASRVLPPRREFDHCPQTFTIGRGNEIVCAAILCLAQRVEGRSLESLVENWGETWRYLVSDSQLRWIGPEKGVIHLALGALVNAIWDLWAKAVGKPVWRIVAEMSPEEFVRCIDFRYITDAITPEEAIEMLREQEKGKAERMKDAEGSRAVPAYTTSAGWIGYGDEKMKYLLQETLSKGYRHFKLKVGASMEADERRLAIARDVIGYDKGNILMVDANQVCADGAIACPADEREGMVRTRGHRIYETPRSL
jgi:hypothetical protein